MSEKSNKTTNFLVWLFVGLIGAAIAIGVLMYIGWFDTRTHVDTPAGDNVTQDYTISDAEMPGEATWENDSNQSLRQIITGETPQTPPQGE